MAKRHVSEECNSLSTMIKDVRKLGQAAAILASFKSAMKAQMDLFAAEDKTTYNSMMQLHFVDGFLMKIHGGKLA